MASPSIPEAICRFPGCDDPVHAEGICRDHYEQFHGTSAGAETEQPRDAPPVAAAPKGRLGLTPMHAVVRLDYGSDSRVVAVYGVYGTAQLAEKAATMITGLDIPGDMQVVPFYEVTP